MAGVGDEDEPLLHYSEDPHIGRFVPHVPATNPEHPPAVWAIDAAHAALYWFPRDCPRLAVWADDAVQRQRLGDLFVTTASRVQAIELGWLARLRDVVLYEYALPRATFRPWDAADGQWVSTATVEPLDVRPVGDLLARHAAAGVELRLVPDLGPLRDRILVSDLPFSMVRLHNRRATGPAADAPGDEPGTLDG